MTKRRRKRTTKRTVRIGRANENENANVNASGVAAAGCDCVGRHDQSGDGCRCRSSRAGPIGRAWSEGGKGRGGTRENGGDIVLPLANLSGAI